MNGFVNIDKPSGVSSAYVVNRVKKKFGVPCGHMGTLDPMASGVLPVAIGKTARLFDYLLDKNKKYVAEFEFGYETDTLDAMGEVVNSGGRIPTLQEVTESAKTQVGEIMQVPPKYSAKNVNGKRSYVLARRGVEFTLPPKKVKINSITVKEISSGKFSFEIDCTGGTYIRSICRDVAKSLSTYATMTKLVRTKSGVFEIENSVGLDEFSNGNAEDYIIPSDVAVDFPKLVLDGSQAKRLLDGLRDSYPLKDGLYRVYAVDEFWGVGIIENGILTMKSYCR